MTIFLLLFQRWLFIKCINPSLLPTPWQDLCRSKGLVLPICSSPIFLTLPLPGIHARAQDCEGGTSAGVQGWTWSWLSCPICLTWRGAGGPCWPGQTAIVDNSPSSNSLCNKKIILISIFLNQKLKFGEIEKPIQSSHPLEQVGSSGFFGIEPG